MIINLYRRLRLLWRQNQWRLNLISSAFSAPKTTIRLTEESVRQRKEKERVYQTQRKEEILRLRFDDCLTLQEIGDRFNITRERVRQIIGNTGEVAIDRRRKDRAKIVLQQWLSGSPTTEIMKELGISKTTCANDIKPKSLSQEMQDEHKLNLLWRQINKGNPDECWEWTSLKYPSGYGRACLHGKNDYIHRVIWILLNGPIPEGKHVLHHCDNPACCNPAHLYVGTVWDNMRDRDKRERNGRYKFTNDEVKEIRKIYQTGRYTQAAIAKAYKVKIGPIHMIVNYKTYKWVS